MWELPTLRILLLLLLPYPFVFIFNADSRAEEVEFRVLQKGRAWVEQGFSKKKYCRRAGDFSLKTIEHPNTGFTFAPRTGTIHLMRLPERPSKRR